MDIIQERSKIIYKDMETMLIVVDGKYYKRHIKPRNEIENVKSTKEGSLGDHGKKQRGG